MAIAGLALLLAIVSLVVTLLQSPGSLSGRQGLSMESAISISGGPLYIGSALPWRYDPQSKRLHYSGRTPADSVTVKMHRGAERSEDLWVREPGTPLSISVKCGTEQNPRTLFLESDRDGQNLELTLFEAEERTDSSHLQILPHLLRDPSFNSRITEVQISGCRRESGSTVHPYVVTGGETLLLVENNQ